MTTWHASDDLLARYTTDPDEIDPATASSLEMHLVDCDRCRAGIAAATDTARLDLSWAAVAARIDAPRRSLAERALHAAGLDPSFARLVMATPALRLSWLGAVVALVAGVVFVATQADDPVPFLAIAPVVPLGAIAAAFLPGRDPAGEAGLPTPLAGFGLALRRAVAVLGPSVAVVAVGSLAVPGVGVVDAAWLLPALCLCATTLAVATWVRADVAAGALATTWLAVVVTAVAKQGAPTRDLAPFAAPGHVVYVLITVVAVAVVVRRRDSFAMARRVQ